MTQSTHPYPHAVADPLTSPQRIMLRNMLDTLWRDTVVEITGLAVQFHDDETPEVAAALAGARRRLVDIESAHERLDSRSYGACDACDRRIPFEQLEVSPARRYCLQCQPASSGSSTNTGISRPARA